MPSQVLSPLLTSHYEQTATVTLFMTTHLQGLLLGGTQLDKSSQLSSVVVSLSDMM